MDGEFTAQLDAWHDFYAATAGVTATLVGLLFVALALNPQVLKSWTAPVLRDWAALTFHNFLVVLTISLVALIPESSPTGIYVPLTFLGVTGVYRIVRDQRRMATYAPSSVASSRRRIRTVWFIGMLIAYGTCLWVAIDLYLGVFDSFDWLVLPVFVLTTYAAASCLELLAEIGAIRGEDTGSR